MEKRESLYFNYGVIFTFYLENVRWYVHRDWRVPYGIHCCVGVLS